MINLQFLGAAQTVTGSCFLIDNGKHRLLVDCGLFQGSKAIKERNYGPFPFDPGSIDALVLTHAHIDHCGLIPKLYLQGYKGPVFTTEISVDLASILLPDSGHIQEMEVERKNRKNSRAGLPLLTPIYTADQAASCLKYFQPLDYNDMQEILPGYRIRLQNAGHILGSAIVEVWVEDEHQEVKLTFSGDLGSPGQPIVKDPSIIETTDYLIVESTYGNRLHTTKKEEKIKQLKEIIEKTMRKGGNLVIPAFAVERTQDLLYILEILAREENIRIDNVYLDSPLAVATTEIFCRYREYFDRQTKDFYNKNCQPFTFPGLSFSRTTEESVAINQIKGGAIIISASGMCDAGRIKHHLKHNLWRPESTVLLIGFQAEGTLGRRLLNGEKQVRIHGEEIAVNADIVYIDGFSAHADQSGLLNWIRSFKHPPKKVFVVHGEQTASEVFADLIRTNLGIDTEVPGWLDIVQLLPTTEKLTVMYDELSTQALAVEADARYQRILAQLKAMIEADFTRKNYDQANIKLKQIESIIKDGQLKDVS